MDHYATARELCCADNGVDRRDRRTVTPFTPKEMLTNGQLHEQNGIALDAEWQSEDGRYVPEEVYWAEYYEHADFNYEWNNGRLEEKPVADYAQFRLYLWFLGLVKDYLYVHSTGRMIGLEMGLRMALPNQITIRKPDLALVLNTNLVSLRDKDRSYRGIFDVCIESLSDSTPKEVERDTVTKRLEYAAAGVQEYYILDERQLETAFYQLAANGIYVPIRPVSGIIHSRVLPGFQFRLADLYRLPEPPELVDDSVYRDFVSPFLRVERERAEREYARTEAATQQAKAAIQQTEQERTRAEEAIQRAAQAQEQAARYAALLKSMGIVVEEPG